MQDGGGVTRLDKPGREGMDPERGSCEYGGLDASQARLNKRRERGLGGNVLARPRLAVSVGHYA